MRDIVTCKMDSIPQNLLRKSGGIMKKYIDSYIADTKKYIENPSPETIEKVKKEHLVQIQFIQHERLIHWLVTMLVCILLFIAVAVLMIKPECSACIPLVILLIGLTVPYMLYYYYIENKTQELYRLYNELSEKEETMRKRDTDE